MNPTPIVYDEAYRIDIGPHIFPTVKFGMVRDALLGAGVAGLDDFVSPEPATWDDLALVHTPGYLDKVRSGRLSNEEIARLEMAWSEEMVEGFRLMAGGTLLAARLAVEAWQHLMAEAIARPGYLVAGIHLGGGFHHAFADHGEGFCLFNDTAVAVRRLLADRAVRRVAIIDTDVHHGNGTASLLGTDPAVFTYSIHQEHNYPAHKPAGTLDRGLRDGAGDEEYLATLTADLPRVFDARPDLIFYIAGADPYEHDQLGGLRITRHGLRRRDRLVFSAACRAGVPVVVLLAGGYARQIEHTIAIHAATVEEARLLALG
jgi:acetoin utilization deacetylase AcuC-like enzyme